MSIVAIDAPAPAIGDVDRPRWEVADIFRQSGEAYRQSHHVPSWQERIMRDIERCRTAALGGHQELCPRCGFERYAYNSCRNRHCPKCQGFHRARWLEKRQAEVLAVPYFHCVFTLPHELNRLVLANKRVLLKMLFRATSQTLLQFGRNNLGGQIGCFMILHTWDQTLGDHFHVHCVIPGGALADGGERWISVDPRFLFPVKALSKVYRGKYLDLLQRAFRRGELNFPAALSHLATPEGFATFQAKLKRNSWVVFAKRPFPGADEVLEYVGRYTHRVAITNHRILHVSEDKVTFTYRNRREKGRIETMTLDTFEFIRRFLLHLLPSDFRRIRYIGFLANRHKTEALRRCRELLGQVPQAPLRPCEAMAELVWRLTGTDITTCPRCGYAPLRRLKLEPETDRARTGAGDPAPLLFDSS